MTFSEYITLIFADERGKMPTLYDQRCKDLARFYLDDAGLGEVDEGELAQLIQETIDDYIQDLEEK